MITLLLLAALDVQHYDTRLDLDVGRGTLKGNVTVTLSSPVTKLVLQAGQLRVSRVTSNGGALQFRRDGETLIIDNAGKSVSIDYDGAPKKGLRFDKGQAYTSFHTAEWMPCNDDPGDKATLRLAVQAPDTVIAVGDQVAHNVWDLKTPAPAYLFAFAVGRFHHVEEEFAGVRWHYYSAKHSPEQLRRMFAPMVQIYQVMTDIAGAPLPVKVYRQVLVSGDIAQEAVGLALIGEHYGDTLLKSPSEDWVITHELAHQWWAVSVGIAGWAEIWLSEGLATFAVALDKERRWGPSWYGREIALALKRAGGNTTPLQGAAGGIAYAKGMLFLHALRAQMGNVQFAANLQRYTKDYAGKLATTQDFEKVMGEPALFKRWAHSTEVEPDAEPLTATLAPDVTVSQLERDVYRFTHAIVHPSNVLAVAMPAVPKVGRSLVIVDTTFTPESMDYVLNWLEFRYGRYSAVGINTHFHLDRVGGNAALIKRKIAVYASDKTNALLAEKGEAMRKQTIDAAKDDNVADRLKAVKLTPADHTFKLGQNQVFRFPGEQVEIRYPGPGHTPDNVVVWFGQRRLLFGGCLVKSEPRLGNVSDADMTHWPAAIEAVSALNPRRVVTGHGEDDSPDTLEVTARLLEEANEKD